MDSNLYDAAARGNERALQELLQKDPLLLERASYTCPDKTPLHVATIHAHLSFVKTVLTHNPDLAQELDSHQSSPLHVASARGYLDICRELLLAAPDMCLSRDCQGRNPLHLAAMKGHLGVLAELIQVAPVAALDRLDQGTTTVLHLCVKYRQLEALKMFVYYLNDLVNAKNDNGDTILHMAVRDKQTETVNFLLTVPTLEVNALNLNGMTPIDILIQSRRDIRALEIEKALKCGGGFATNIEQRRHQNTSAPQVVLPAPYNLDNEQKNILEKLLKRQDEWLEKKRSALMVVASLIATMAFQVGVNPPTGVWQEDTLDDNSQVAYLSVLPRDYPRGYEVFYIINTTSFIASLSIILLLMSGLPLRKRFFMWILMVITWIAITAIALTYAVSITVFTQGQLAQGHQRY